ncbi:MAG: hypothetical protein IH613_00670 [Desulfuromonadales bacterium]|nr:hypothetical protein [Desulfuromonadales bacterium]
MNDTWKMQRDILNSIPEFERLRIQEENAKEAEALYKEFTAAFSKEMCDSCGKPINTFSKESPCFHWLLRPGKAKKEHIEKVLREKGYFRCAAYIKWVSNFESHFKYINNLSEEGNLEALFHWSAKYKHIKWTFWCTRNDYAGHNNQPPHFHFEMRLDKMPFIKFNDFHIPFSEEDLFNIRSHEDPESPVKQTFGFYGAGLEEAFSLDTEKLLNGLTTTENQEEAVYHVHTVLHSEEGIPVEVINKAMAAAKKKKVPVAKILRGLGYDAKVVIEPAESLITKESRSNPRQKKLSSSSVDAELDPPFVK